MIDVLRAARLIAAKDLRTELRTGEVVVGTGLFAVLIVILASLSFYVDTATAKRIAPGVLWIAIAFGGVLAMTRSWAQERENDVLRGILLTPIPRAALYVGKGLSVLAFMVAIEIFLCPLVALLFHVDLVRVAGSLFALVFLGTVGFVAAGTLFSAMTVRTRARDLALSIVLFPLITPALIAGVVATREVLAGASFSETIAWMRILLAFDLVFIAAGLWLFDALISD